MSNFNKFKLLLVEDNQQDRQNCIDCIKDFESEKRCNIELVISENAQDALSKLNGSFDAAIIDLKLGSEGHEGNQVIDKIEESHFRIPVAILTATPDATGREFAHIGIFIKGERGAAYNDLLEIFWNIHNTGLTRIMGGRGKIEETLNKVYLQNLLPQKDKWVTYGKVDSLKTEKALLRHAISHLLQLLDDEGECYYPEEVYLAPPLNSQIRTGSIVKEKSTEMRFVVMNPACDLVIRDDGKCKTDRILTVAIDLQRELFPDYPTSGLSSKQQGELKNAFNNKKSLYYHWLPKTDFFEGGFLCFRKLSTLTQEDFNKRFDPPDVQISPSFVKDIIARFSAYYARQGQPEIDLERFINLSS